MDQKERLNLESNCTYKELKERNIESFTETEVQKINAMHYCALACHPKQQPEMIGQLRINPGPYMATKPESFKESDLHGPHHNTCWRRRTNPRWDFRLPNNQTKPYTNAIENLCENNFSFVNTFFQDKGAFYVAPCILWGIMKTLSSNSQCHFLN